mmetsp:Transcript_12240/g.23376  ORF Transcript_12240/g.23376 Transcript_12240/m.23376 type:complete len:395 (+) Transcript_12240:241-1425(+)
MMIFDTNPSDENNIVIVPPQPDFAFQTQDEFSYSNLYCYDDTTVSNNNTTSNNSTTANNANNANGNTGNTGNTTPRSASVTTNSTSTLSSKESSTAAIADTTRNPRNGAFTFQVHAEYDLLLHIQKDLDKHRSRAKSSSVELSRMIMKSVDEYCLQKQWMYHIGSEKGVAIGRFLRAGIESFRRKQVEEGVGGEVKKFICVELGTYCGYSALVLATTLRQFIQEQEQNHDQPPFEFQIYTTEVSSKLLNVAQSVFRLAKMEHNITPILVKSDDDAAKIDEATKKNRQKSRSELSQTLLNQHGVTHIDFLLLDHAKHLYLDDLRDLEDAGLLRGGSRVSADNVVFNRLDAYRDHVHTLELEGVVESRLEEMNLEYSNNLKDGMEMTVYLKDPPIR